MHSAQIKSILYGHQLTARSLNKKSTASEISSGSANFPSGMEAIIGSRLAGSFQASCNRKHMGCLAALALTAVATIVTRYANLSQRG